MQLQDMIRLAIYVIPTGEIFQSIYLLQRMLNETVGVIAALKLPVHATVQGFFVPTIENPYVDLIDNLRSTLVNFPPIKLKLGRINYYNRDVLYIKIIDFENSYSELREVTRKATNLYIKTEGANSIDKDYKNLPPHFTLAFKDYSPKSKRKTFEMLKKSSLPQYEFFVDRLALVSFQSSNWNGMWWKTLNWKTLIELPLGGKDHG